MEDKNIYIFNKLSFVFCIRPIFQVFWDSNTVNSVHVKSSKHWQHVLCDIKALIIAITL